MESRTAASTAATTNEGSRSTYSVAGSKRSRNGDTIERSVAVLAAMEARTIDIRNADFDEVPQEVFGTHLSTASSVTRTSNDSVFSGGNTIASDSISSTSSRVQKNTLGNSHILPQCLRREKRAELRVHNPAKALADIFNDEQLFFVLQKSRECCEKNVEFGGCIRKHFLTGNLESDGSREVDLVGLQHFVRSARKERGKLDGDQLDSFIQEKIRSSITGEKLQSNGKVQFDMKWAHLNREVCRQSFSLLFNISKHKLDSCSAALKLSDTRRVSSIVSKTWNDTHVHSFTYAETEKMMKEALKTEIVGKSTLLSTH